MFASLARAALLSAILLPAGVVQAAQPLFSALPAMKFADAAGDRVAEALQRDASVVSLQFVHADARQVVADTKTLSFDIAAGRHLTLLRTFSQANPDGTLVWEGALVDSSMRATKMAPAADDLDPLNNAIVVRNGDRLTGSLRIAGKLWRIAPLANGTHAIVEVDEARMPPDHPAGHVPRPVAALDDLSLEELRATRAASVDSRSGRVGPLPAGSIVPHRPAPSVNPEPAEATTIRAMVVVTAAAAAASGDTTGMVNLAIAETNQGYRVSRVDIHMELAGWYPSDYVEQDFDTDLDTFTNGTGLLAGFHAIRDSIAADVGVLIINDPQYCGLGWLNADAGHAFSAVHHSCATGYYSFGHEIGHNQGAHHDPLNGTNQFFAFGHGFQAPAQGWRTIMAYACSSANCTRLNAWSNPRRFLGGKAMGTSNRSDNHRVLNLTRSRVAGFR
jgi:hypothetical protein